MMAATIRSGHLVAVPHTPSAAIITAMLPIASLGEQSRGGKGNEPPNKTVLGLCAGPARRYADAFGACWSSQSVC